MRINILFVCMNFRILTSINENKIINMNRDINLLIEIVYIDDFFNFTKLII